MPQSISRKAIAVIAGIVLLTIIAAGGAWMAARTFQQTFHPEPETIVSASLQGLREQNRLTAFIGSYVAVVTSRQSRFGLSAEKTIILPGMVRYEVDLAKLDERSVRWDTTRNALFVTLPDIEVTGPQIDLAKMREYDQGGLLLRLTDTGAVLDDANRRAAQAELLKQARQPVPMNLARDAARRAVQHSFALPLRASGLNGEVLVRFAGEPDFPAVSPEPMDRSRPWQEVYGNRSGG